MARVPGVAAIAVVSALAAAAALASVAAAFPPSAPAVQGPRAGPAAPGRELFLKYCASCHGTSGQGDGPMAALLRHPPSDVTRYALANGGTVPAARLERLIDGRDVGSHGTREMPVWGDAFKTTDGGLTPAQVRGRIESLVTYLGSIQKRNAH